MLFAGPKGLSAGDQVDPLNIEPNPSEEVASHIDAEGHSTTATPSPEAPSPANGLIGVDQVLPL
jgi:hypothetical protein